MQNDNTWSVMVWLSRPVYFVMYLLLVTCLDLKLLKLTKFLCVCSYIILGRFVH